MLSHIIVTGQATLFWKPTKSTHARTHVRTHTIDTRHTHTHTHARTHIHTIMQTFEMQIYEWRSVCQVKDLLHVRPVPWAVAQIISTDFTALSACSCSCVFFFNQNNWMTTTQCLCLASSLLLVSGYSVILDFGQWDNHPEVTRVDTEWFFCLPGVFFANAVAEFLRFFFKRLVAVLEREREREREVSLNNTCLPRQCNTWTVPAVHTSCSCTP